MTAVIILNYNDAQSTIEAVKRIHDFRLVDRIIVVDNASTDGSASTMQKVFTEERLSKVTLIRSDRNGGYGAGNNLGVRYAFRHFQADHALIANPDSVFSEQLLRDMLAVFEKEPQAGAVGAVAAYGDGTGKESEKPEKMSYEELKRSGWKERNLTEELLASGPVLKRLSDRKINYERSYYAGGTELADGSMYVPVYAVHGSLLMVAVPPFIGIGGYDERMFLYMEEYVLGARMRETGLRTFLLEKYYRHEGSHSITGAGNGAVRRQQYRQDSERIYYRYYLKAGFTGRLAARILQLAVLTETRLFAVLSRD